MNTPLNPVSYIVMFGYGPLFPAKEQKVHVLDMITISFYLSVRIIENLDNWCSDNWELTVPYFPWLHKNCTLHKYGWVTTKNGIYRNSSNFWNNFVFGWTSHSKNIIKNNNQ